MTSSQKLQDCNIFLVVYNNPRHFHCDDMSYPLVPTSHQSFAASFFAITSNLCKRFKEVIFKYCHCKWSKAKVSLIFYINPTDHAGQTVFLFFPE